MAAGMLITVDDCYRHCKRFMELCLTEGESGGLCATVSETRLRSDNGWCTMRDMTHPRQDWSYVQQRIRERAKQLGIYSKAALKRASGLSLPTVDDFYGGPRVRATGSDNRHPETIPRLCDALRWQHDAIDRLMAGQEPLDVDDTPENVKRLPDTTQKRLDRIDSRVSEIEAVAKAGLAAMQEQQSELAELHQLLRRLEDDVALTQQDTRSRLARLETAVDGLRRGEHPGDAGQI